ncbi:MAG: phytanoyl-CoA dioxygenase family protein [Anaerolineaceae bacterium]|nr:phytanoyl-CoA dioxygenase family protein [Anaerolineaceae bacterium]
MIVTDAQREQYRREGYFILESVIPEAALEGLRGECGSLLARRQRRLEARGIAGFGLDFYRRNESPDREWRPDPLVRDFLFSDLMAEVGRATLGEDVFLFNEEYDITAAGHGITYDSHLGSRDIGHFRRPYLSCCCALDDMTVELFEHRVEGSSNDRVGYHGDDPAVAALAPAGSMVVFSSRVVHRSGPNTSERMRRVYLAQFSAEPIMNREWNQSIPLLLNGERQPAPQPADAAN